ncbi:MAG TPA: peptidylprolyl isomerase, partial [Terriglobales bacterium]|nr:peptidylprolyl isomerase [Terriglobales bacterium]
ARGPGVANLKAGRGLPDTVLAVLRGQGTAERTIGRSEFMRAWAQVTPPDRPDSLTPSGARRFLELLLDREALVLRARREREAWSAAESASYAVLRDRLLMKAMLDSVLAGTDPAASPEEAGLAARDRAMARLQPVFDDSLAARVASAFAALARPAADSSLGAQLRALSALPRVDPADTGRAIARSRSGDLRVSELLASWSGLDPLVRPRVETGAQVRDLVMNALFSRDLREQAARAAAALERRPEIEGRLREERARDDVARLVAREVYARIPSDSLTLLRHYRETEAQWALPTRVRLVSLQLETRGAAEAMGRRLESEAETESLVSRGRQARASWELDLAEAQDSILFARALRAGPGAVIGPDDRPGGWVVTRVVAVLPGRPRSFAEARADVSRQWFATEAERRTRGLALEARRALRIRVNERALEALTRDAAPIPRN